MTDKSDDEALIDGLIDTLAALEEQEVALRALRAKLEPIVSRLYGTWKDDNA